MTFNFGIRAALDLVDRSGKSKATLFTCGCRLHLIGTNDPAPDWRLCSRHLRLERKMHHAFVDQYGSCATRAA